MDCLGEWPEPVRRVQAIAESGSPVIPERYIKPLSERPGLEPAGSELGSVPVIDLGALRDGEVGLKVGEACREWGFFEAVNHGVPNEVIERMREVWRGFFALPLHLKQEYANNPKTYEGYGSRLGVEKGALLDWGDYYFLNLLPPALNDPMKWPALPANCRETIQEYSEHVLRLCKALLKAMSLGLGLREYYLQEAFGGDDVGSCMRINFYPKCPQPELTLGLSSHSDPGGLTVLLPDERVKGLQVRHRDSWVTVSPGPHSFIINIGDQIQVMTNAGYKSVEHRVMANSVLERLSVAFFYNPKSDLLIGPAPDLVAPDSPALYSPMTFDQYRLFIRQRGPRGKSQVQSLESKSPASSPRTPPNKLFS
ncbi:probable 2-oxoglutarate-dependent dioxygenase At3g111800 [Amborella trichopoda]|uniref:Fe2OG dioxygenase domain-containing protein n=1 Tax=Amborella trichopoda TaxID=13333 RepID=W1PBE2_AMBTC|nr:probable 2-oxoglutarate-dependent dioxygenase At3g111800 [Amborella trichopoda]ERN05253.1 hypothetical protein AMTR_s00007p00108780 [Amborella trichopoda]|eukprot:XP_006843578.1 probable 2-oxoglutarate-dependent dioxygenase At3g111800 [Amborella trichopoda]